MSKYLGMTNDEIFALKGADLKTAAAELDIAGRSKMKVDELRAAVHAEIIIQRRLYPTAVFSNEAEVTAYDIWLKSNPGKTVDEFLAAIVLGPSNDITEKLEPEKFELLPNRKARREAARRQRKAAGRIAQKHNRNN